MFELELQLHGGGGHRQEIKQNAPGSVAAATVDNATEDALVKIREQIAKGRGRKFTDKTGGVTSSIKKILLGE